MEILFEQSNRQKRRLLIGLNIALHIILIVGFVLSGILEGAWFSRDTIIVIVVFFVPNALASFWIAFSRELKQYFVVTRNEIHVSPPKAVLGVKALRKFETSGKKISLTLEDDTTVCVKTNRADELVAILNCLLSDK